MQYYLWAFLIGGLSAVSLLIGSILGSYWKPSRNITSSLTAFGAGALLSALAIELVAPTVLQLMEPHQSSQQSIPKESFDAFIMLLMGSVIGGVLFVVLDQVINQQGGYLRKTATTIAYHTQRQKARLRIMVKKLSQIEVLRNLPPDQIQMLVNSIYPRTYHKDERLFSKGDKGDEMYFIEKGEIVLSDEHFPEIDVLGDGDLLGEISLITGAPRTANAVAKKNTRVFVLLKKDFERLKQYIPQLDNNVTQLASQRLESIKQRKEAATTEEIEWMKQAMDSLREGAYIPSPKQVKNMSEEHSSAPLAIWLGIFLDGIPESLVIGASFGALIAAFGNSDPSFFNVIPYTLIAGLFLSNFPEALSSSASMKKIGWPSYKVILLWSSIVLTTAIGAFVGYIFGSQLSHGVIVFIEGLAAGAMLTMIAETMIPEAVHLGNPNIVGLSTLAGFLSVIIFKLLEI